MKHEPQPEDEDEDEDEDLGVARVLVILALVVSFVVPLIYTIVAEALMIKAKLREVRDLKQGPKTKTETQNPMAERED